MLTKDTDNVYTTCRALVGRLLFAGVFLASRDATAVDGNYSSPYGSQWATASTQDLITNETLLGLMLLTLNMLLAVIFYARDKRRRRA